jgi:hypothetical protein
MLIRQRVLHELSSGGGEADGASVDDGDDESSSTIGRYEIFAEVGGATVKRVGQPLRVIIQGGSLRTLDWIWLN